MKPDFHTELYPLRFIPIFRRYLWGGTRLKTVLNKSIGEKSCAESWEIVDHGQDQSVVSNGPLAGATLKELVAVYGVDLLGESNWERINRPDIPETLRGRFPLLLKFLDADQNLSVQVHPDDELARTLSPPDLGKTEAWFVLHAEENAQIYAGLQPDVTLEQLRMAIDRGTVHKCLHRFLAKAGDCVLVRAGTLHALGAGLLIAEIQQASDSTFRVFDWNRTDADGKVRTLHIEPALQATNFQLGPVNPLAVRAADHPATQLLVSTDKFQMHHWSIDNVTRWTDSRLHILAVTRGKLDVTYGATSSRLSLGETALLPAVCSSIILQPRPTAEFLDIFLPE